MGLILTFFALWIAVNIWLGNHCMPDNLRSGMRELWWGGFWNGFNAAGVLVFVVHLVYELIELL